jgi:hypothetical protein
MKKQFENIDDLFLSKINNLDDSDVELNEHLIWKDIENQLDNKKSIRILWWKYASAACVFLLLGLAYFQFLKRGISTKDLATQKTFYKKKNKVSNELNSKKYLVQNNIQKSDNQLFINKKSGARFSKNKNLKEILTPQKMTSSSEDLFKIEPLNFKNIQKTEIAFNSTEIKPVVVVLPKKLRVMHIEDFQIQPIDRINQPKTFYVFFNKEFNIDNQLPTVSIARPNNVN